MGITYILRKQNQVADCLARQDLSVSDDLRFFDSPPNVNRRLHDMDKMTVFFTFSESIAVIN